VVFSHWPEFVFTTCTVRTVVFSEYDLLCSGAGLIRLCHLPQSMAVVLISIHFDHDQVSRIPSCHRLLVLRPFYSHDFVTGVPAIPGRELSVDVSSTRVTISVYICMCCIIT
jgi:hypothetical protein